jgi:hypothetical protein
MPSSPIWPELIIILTELATSSPTVAKDLLDRATSLFESENLNIDRPDLNPDSLGKLRSYQTEIYRLLRLLHTDLAFLTSASTPEKRSQRQQTYQQRVQTAIEFCQAAIELY